MLRACLSDVWRNFQGHLAEVKTSAVLWGRSSPKIMHKFSFWIDPNVTRQKHHTRSQRMQVLWIKWLVYRLPAGLLALKSQSADGWWNLPSGRQRAEGREWNSSQRLAPFPCVLRQRGCLHGCPIPASDPAAEEWARSLPGLCPVSVSKAESFMKWYFCTCRLQSDKSQMTATPALGTSASSILLFHSGWSMW